MRALRYLLTVPVILAALSGYTFAQSGDYCCLGRVGDANGDGGDEPTIGDISVIVETKFINSALEIKCLPEADINQSGGVYPTVDDLTIGDIAYLIDYLFISGPSNSSLSSTKARSVSSSLIIIRRER